VFPNSYFASHLQNHSCILKKEVRETILHAICQLHQPQKTFTVLLPVTSSHLTGEDASISDLKAYSTIKNIPST
jgi:hypothetical protein